VPDQLIPFQLWSSTKLFI